jgi:pyruvate formate-lyase/glycerol dehydratase family glycyl radical enzyme
MERDMPTDTIIMSGCCGQDALTPQEQYFLKQFENDQVSFAVTDEGKDKMFRIMDELMAKPRLSMTRAKLLTDSFKTTEGQPIILRYAKAMKHIASNLPISILSEDVIIGRVDHRPSRSGLFYPELHGGFVKKLKGFSKDSAAGFYIEPEDEIYLDEISEYWGKDTIIDSILNALPADTRNIVWDPIKKNASRFIITSTILDRSGLQWSLDYEKVINKGFDAIRAEAQEKLSSIPKGDSETRSFLEAILIICDGIVLFSNRYSQLAADMSQTEVDPKRAKELKLISDICSRVPGKPSKTFREGLQAMWIAQIFSRLEEKIGGLLGCGRIDQYLLPLYEKDLAAGRITKEEAKFYFQNIWINMAYFSEIFPNPDMSSFWEGYAHFEVATIGGKTKEGDDATNALSYLILESKKGIPINYPEIAVRVHSRSPQRFLYAACELSKEGGGYPKFFNDEEIIPLYIAKGARIEDANDYCQNGCTEPRLLNRETYINGGTWVNMGAAIEMMLNDGKIVSFANEQIGHQTGNPREFISFEQVKEAFKAQQEFLLKHAIITQGVSDRIKPQFIASPLLSSLHDLCMADCKDIHRNDIKGSLDLIPVDAVGFGTAADSLTAIKKLVFDDKILTMSELIDALASNFEGREDIRQLCLNAPKYGNSDTYADSIARWIDHVSTEFLTNNPRHIGTYDLRYVPITSHIVSGKIIAATPNGRYAGKYLSEGTTASHGCDVSGPTALLISIANAKCTHLKTRSARLLNLKFSPGSVAGHEGTKKFAAFIRTWMNLKLWHIQFNIFNKKTLIAAQKDPEAYRNLIVRVAGYSAYFNELSLSLQNEIIERTEVTL